MERLRGKKVLVTGASSGIGRACARRFAGAGASVAAWARRGDRLRELEDELRAAAPEGGHVTAEVDVREREPVFQAVEKLVAAWGVPHILLNNAGLAAGLDPIQAGDPDDWDRMIDTNIKGLLNVTRAVLPRMIEQGRGHVINIGSTAGHLAYPKGNVYGATKFAVRALTEGMSLDLVGTPIRVSSVDPGMVQTEFSDVRFHGDQERAAGVYRGLQPLTPDDIADIVAYIAGAPEHVNILDVVVYPTAQRNVYVVDRTS
jgi:serine 3-dehydrogenase